MIISPRRERTRERLLDAAFEEFARQGVQATSIESVCEAAGFTRGAFYSNFASKEELFLALTERETRVQLARLEAAVAGLGPDVACSAQGVRDAVRHIVASIVPDPDAKRSWHLMALEFELLALRDPDIGARYGAQEDRLRGELVTALDRVVTDIGLRFVLDTRTAVDLLLGAHESGMRTALLPGQDDRPNVLLEELVDLVIAPA